LTNAEVPDDILWLFIYFDILNHLGKGALLLKQDFLIYARCCTDYNSSRNQLNDQHFAHIIRLSCGLITEVSFHEMQFSSPPNGLDYHLRNAIECSNNEWDSLNERLHRYAGERKEFSLMNSGTHATLCTTTWAVYLPKTILTTDIYSKNQDITLTTRSIQ
jgi:hypothetical protein